jgi:cyclic pyranopterin phosphate synthase
VSKLTHLDEQGAARMVDVSGKDATDRMATAQSAIRLSREAFAAIMDGTAPKGDVLAAARIAGIMAAKKTSDLIPLCHPLALTGSTIAFEPDADASTIRILASVKTSGQTGVEMEALVAASVAALTVYDMVKAIDKAAIVENVRLLTKSGGKSGDFVAAEQPMAKTPPLRARSSVKPSELPTGGFTPRPAENKDKREAFRGFMTSRHLRATDWAKDAGVPVSAIYSFLTGKTRTIPDDTAEKLARVARARVEDMFR